MSDNRNTLASAGTAALCASAARIVLPFGPRIAFAPDGVGGGDGDEAALNDVSDAELGLDDEEGAAPAPAERQDGNERELEGDAEEDLPEGQDEDEPEPEEDAEKEKSDADDNLKVKLDDGNEVNLGELKKGYLRQADYTRKTQEVARDRTEVKSAADRLFAFDQQTKQAIQLAAQIIQEYTPKPPDPALLHTGRAEDQGTYLAQKEFYERGVGRLNQLAGALQQQESGAKGLSSEEQRALVGREMDALIGKMPELRDAAKRAAIMNDINQGAQSAYGFSSQELAAITDHRVFPVLRDALAYRKLQANKSATIAKVTATAPMRPATRQASAQRVQAGQARDFERARRTGSEDDVARLITSAELGL